MRINHHWIVCTFLAISVAGSLTFSTAYVLHDSPQFESLGLTIALGAMAAAVVVWALHILPPQKVVDVRDDYPSSPEDVMAAQAELASGYSDLSRSGLLMRFFYAAVGTLGVAALFPLRSLAPRFNAGLYHTKWRAGARLVRENGTPVHVGDLAIGSVLTVFPEGNSRDPNSQTLLLRLPLGIMQSSAGRADWSPAGFVAFSKVCTHAGCPVGLYRQSAYQLLCPCHQSVFDVVKEAQPVSGPAARALPQLPLRIAQDGYLIAQSDYREPVGPGFWYRA